GPESGRALVGKVRRSQTAATGCGGVSGTKKRALRLAGARFRDWGSCGFPEERSADAFAVVLDAGDEADFRGEFEEPGGRVGGFAEVGGVGLLVGALVDGERESDEFEDAEAEAGNRLADAADGAGG